MAQDSPILPANVLRAVKQKLESLQAAGISHLPKAKIRSTKSATERPIRAEPIAKPAPAVAARMPSKAATLPTIEAPSATELAQAAPSREAPSREAALAIVAQRVAKCTRCS